MSRLFSSGKPRFGLFVLTSGEKTFLLWKGKLLLLPCRRPSCSKNTGQIAMPSFLSRFPDKCSCISKRMGLIYCHLVSENSCDRFLKLVQALLNRHEIKYGGRCTPHSGLSGDRQGHILTCWYILEKAYCTDTCLFVQINNSFEIILRFASKQCSLTTSIGELWTWMQMNFECFLRWFAAKCTRRSRPQ